LEGIATVCFFFYNEHLGDICRLCDDPFCHISVLLSDDCGSRKLNEFVSMFELAQVKNVSDNFERFY